MTDMIRPFGTLDRREVVAELLRDREDLLLVTGLGSPTYDAAAVEDHHANFYLWGAMGGAALMGLGLALAQPSRPVLVITGDGEQLMGLGGLATIAVKKPANLSIVVLDNGHSHIADTTNAYREACGDLLGSLHLNDNDGARDGHVMPGAGTFDWNGFMPWLASTVYEGPLMLETEARDQQDDLPAVLSETFTAVEHHILRR